MRPGFCGTLRRGSIRVAEPAREISLQRTGGGKRVAANQFIKQRGTPMDFTMSERQREWLGRVQSFMKNHVRPAVPIYRKQDEEEIGRAHV